MADDSRTVIESLKRVLTEAGYEVLATDRGDTAWEMLQDPNAPYLVVLDWIMPGMTGPELCRKLRLHPPRPGYTYVMLLTSKSQGKDVMQALESGADDYLIKPVSKNDFLARLHRAERVLKVQNELLRFESASGNLRKVLVADDSETVRTILDRVLTKAGYDVQLTTDGPSTFATMQQPGAPQMALLDWLMPGMTGVDICRQIRALHPNRSIFLMLLTAKSGCSDLVHALDNGADDYLIKPFHPDELLARLRVARRNLAMRNELTRHKTELQKYAEEMEGLLLRHNLLSDIFSRSDAPRPQSSDPAADAVCDLGKTVLSFNTGVKELRSIQKLNQIYTRVLDQIRLKGMVSNSSAASSSAVGSNYLSWSALVLDRPAVWLDVIMRVDRASARALYQALLGTSEASARDYVHLLAEIHSILQGALKKALEEEGVATVAPFVPRVVLDSEVPDFPSVETGYGRFEFTLPDIRFDVMLCEQTAEHVEKSIPELHLGDVLSNPRQVFREADGLLRGKAVVLNEFHLRRAREMAATLPPDIHVSVLKPSLLARLFVCGNAQATTS